MAKPPAVLWYFGEFLNGTVLFSNEEEGIYIRLLGFQWENERLPRDKKVLCKLARCSIRKLETVLTKFTLDDRGYFNERMEHERAKQAAFRARQSVNGHKGWIDGKRRIVKPGLSQTLARPQGLPIPDHIPAQFKTETEGGTLAVAGEGTGGEPVAFIEIMPEILSKSPIFLSVWALWVSERAERGVPMSGNAARTQFLELESWGLNKAIQALRNAVSSHHSRPFEPQENYANNTNGNTGQNARSALKSAAVAAEGIVIPML